MTLSLPDVVKFLACIAFAFAVDAILNAIWNREEGQTKKHDR